MKKIRFAILFLILALSVSAWTPAPVQAAASHPLVAGPQSAAQAATTVQVVINNKTGATVTITLTGPTYYNLTLKTGKNKIQVTKGNYTFSYTACKVKKTGKFNASQSGAVLLLPSCGKTTTGKMVHPTIQNSTGGYITIILSGPASYRFVVATGKHKIDVLAGKYSYTVYGCGGASKSGTVKLSSSTNWTWFCY